MKWSPTYDFTESARLSWERAPQRYRPSAAFLKTVAVLLTLIALASAA